MTISTSPGRGCGMLMAGVAAVVAPISLGGASTKPRFSA